MDEKTNESTMSEAVYDALDDVIWAVADRATVRNELDKAKSQKKRSAVTTDLEVAELKVREALGKLAEATSSQLATACLGVIEDQQYAGLSTDEVYAEVLKGLPAPDQPPAESDGEASVAGVQENAHDDGQPGEEPASLASPVSVPLPFPVPPFDDVAALEDIFRLTRKVEANRRDYERSKEETADFKKQWEASAKACEQATTHYEENYRAWQAASNRQDELEAAHLEKLADDAAKAAAPELQLEPTSTPEERVPDLAAAGKSAQPITDSLPACICGAALALDTEKARGTCDECALGV